MNSMPARLLVLAALLPIAADAATPLFSSDATLAIRIEAPMRDLVRYRLKKPEYPAVVTVTDGSGGTVEVPATISTRGNARLEVCDFPPIELDFEAGQAAGTVFEGLDELKLVTQCRRGAAGERWVHQEYGVYRAYNRLTEASHRVRMLDVTYQDATSARWNRETPAFAIEPFEVLADRLGREMLRPARVDPAQLDAGETAMSLLFQYLIGNTDFAVKRGPEGEGCCHNGRVFAVPGTSDGWIVVPYDFDQAGVVDTEYALPDERLGIRRVTQRAYRGFCAHNDRLAGAIGRMNAEREAITAELAPAMLSSSARARATRFIDGFYDIVNDPEELREKVLAQCRGAAAFEVHKTRTTGR